MKRPAGSYLGDSIRYSCVDSAGPRPKGLGLIVVLLTLAATMSFSSCGSQGLSSSGTSANALNGTNSALPSQPSPFNTPGVAHDVSLNWNPSASSGIQGYNVYRGTGPGGPFIKLNSAALPLTTFTDTGVQSGQTYYYVVTATDAGNVESVYSNEVSAAIP